MPVVRWEGGRLVVRLSRYVDRVPVLLWRGQVLSAFAVVVVAFVVQGVLLGRQIQRTDDLARANTAALRRLAADEQVINRIRTARARSQAAIDVLYCRRLNRTYAVLRSSLRRSIPLTASYRIPGFGPREKAAAIADARELITELRPLDCKTVTPTPAPPKPKH